VPSGRLDRLKASGAQASATAVDESGRVSADYSEKFPWNKVSDNTARPTRSKVTVGLRSEAEEPDLARRGARLLSLEPNRRSACLPKQAGQRLGPGRTNSYKHLPRNAAPCDAPPRQHSLV
jgi:hypothetical protein